MMMSDDEKINRTIITFGKKLKIVSKNNFIVN